MKPKLIPLVVNALRDRSLGLFFAGYVINPTVDGFPGHLDFIYDLWLEESSTLSVIAAIQAVSLAHLSNRYGAPQLTIKARQEYVKALKLTNTMLKGPMEALKDCTLVAIWLLGLFEVFENEKKGIIACS